MVFYAIKNIFEKIGLTVKLLKIFDSYFYDLATNEKIAITHLLYAMELQTRDCVSTQCIPGQDMVEA